MKTTNYEWKIGPDKDTSWYEAKEWTESLGNSWKLPTLEELKELYKNHPNITKNGFGVVKQWARIPLGTSSSQTVTKGGTNASDPKDIVLLLYVI